MRISAVVLITPALFSIPTEATSPKFPMSSKLSAFASYQPLTINGVVAAAATSVFRMVREVDEGTLPQSEFDDLVVDSPVLKAGMARLCSSPMSPRGDSFRIAVDRQCDKVFAYLDESTKATLKSASNEERYKFFMEEKSLSKSSSRGDSPAILIGSTVEPTQSAVSTVTSV